MTFHFTIIPLWIENTVMLSCIFILSGGIIYGIKKHNSKIIFICIAWFLLSIYFFNSHFWGFSSISISSEGVKLNYGILSIEKNKILSPPISCSITHKVSKIPFRETYYLVINNYHSMGLTSKKLDSLKKICNILNSYESSLQ